MVANGNEALKGSNLDTWKISAKELLDALAFIGRFVEENHDEALKIVQASLSAKSKTDKQA